MTNTAKVTLVIGIIIAIIIPTYIGYTFNPFSKRKPIQEYVNVESNDTCYIPYQMTTGIYMLNANIYDMNVPCMFDTGCGFPLAISEIMYEKLKDSYDVEDLQYYGQSSTANGNVDTWYFTLPELSINGIRFYNIKCGVSQYIQTPLIGGLLFSAYETVTINSEKSKIILIKK